MANRHTVHDKFSELLESPTSRKLTPALELANSVTDLRGPALDALDLLLQIFQEHPNYGSTQRYVDALAAKLAARG
jgi:hypothetical protein